MVSIDVRRAWVAALDGLDVGEVLKPGWTSKHIDSSIQVYDG